MTSALDHIEALRAMVAVSPQATRLALAEGARALTAELMPSRLGRRVLCALVQRGPSLSFDLRDLIPGVTSATAINNHLGALMAQGWVAAEWRNGTTRVYAATDAGQRLARLIADGPHPLYLSGASVPRPWQPPEAA